MKKIIYIHGFASNENSDKSKLLKEYFGDDNVISPSLPVEPKQAISLLEDIIKKENYNVFLIGSSLGGFYSWYLCEHLEVFGIQINPLVDILMLNNRIGDNINLYTGEKFEFKPEYIEQLESYKKSILDINYKLLTVFLGIDDEIIDSTQTENDIMYRYSKIYKFEDNHRFLTFNDRLDLINNIINKNITI